MDFSSVRNMIDIKAVTITIPAQEIRTLTCVFQLFTETLRKMEIDIPDEVKRDMGSVLEKVMDKVLDQLIDKVMEN